MFSAIHAVWLPSIDQPDRPTGVPPLYRQTASDRSGMDCGNTWALGARGKSRNKARKGSRDDGPVGVLSLGPVHVCLVVFLAGCLVVWLVGLDLLVGWMGRKSREVWRACRVLGRTGLAGWADGWEVWMGGKARTTFCWSISFGTGVSTGNSWLSLSLSLSLALPDTCRENVPRGDQSHPSFFPEKG